MSKLDEILGEIRKLHEAHPEQRFLQLLCNYAKEAFYSSSNYEEMSVKDPFYTTDERFLELLRASQSTINVDNCPTCGEKYTTQCRCPKGKRTCAKGHTWWRASGLRLIGSGDCGNG